MPGAGVEPARPEGHPILSRARLTDSATPASAESTTPGLFARLQERLRVVLRPVVAEGVAELRERVLVELRAGAQVRPGLDHDLVPELRERSDEHRVRVASVEARDLVDA